MGWTVRGLNPGGGKVFCTCPDRPWGRPSLLYNGYQVFPGGKERPGHDADPSPPSSAVGHERVELYLYSPRGPYGLYRASVSVQGCTLPLPYMVQFMACLKCAFSHCSELTVFYINTGQVFLSSDKSFSIHVILLHLQFYR
jgi:hypothetical protein